jgi:hypothetical protein
MTTNLIVNHWRIAFRKLREYLRALEHVEIIVGTCHAEERMPNHRYNDAIDLNDIHASVCLLYCPYHAKEQFFHSRCMQSILPI